MSAYRRATSLFSGRCWVILGCLTAVAGCNASIVAPNGAVLVNGVQFGAAELRVAESFPVEIGVTVPVENRSSGRQTISFPDGCVVLMRAYGEGSTPAWDMAGAVACTGAIVTVMLEPGESRVFQTGLMGAATVLGDSLPSGAYRITAYLRGDSGTVELEAGTVDLAIP